MTVSSSRPAAQSAGPLARRGGSAKSAAGQQPGARVESARSSSSAGSFVDRCDVKHLSEEMEAARISAAERRRQEKERAARDLQAQNRAWRARIASAGKKGRDDKALTEELEKKRQEAEIKRKAEKQAREKALAEQNKETALRLRRARSAGRDVKEHTPEEEMARVEAARRRAEDRARNTKLLAEDNKKYSERLRQASARGRDVKALSEEIEAVRAKKKTESLAAKKAAQRALAAYNREMHLRLYGPDDELETSFSVNSEVSFDSCTDDDGNRLASEVSLLAAELDVHEIKKIVEGDREAQQQATQEVMEKVHKMQRERKEVMMMSDVVAEPNPLSLYE